MYDKIEYSVIVLVVFAINIGAFYMLFQLAY